MGGHYGTIHVRTEDRDAVRSSVEDLVSDRARRYLIAPAINGWVTIFPENNGQDSAVSKALATKLPDKTIIHCVVHDDDVFAYWLFEGGQTVDTYNSCPNYFSDKNPPPRGGNAAAFSDLLANPKKVQELQSLLDADRFDFELERQDRFAALLGLPNTAYAYEYLQGGETDGVRQWKKFIHVPDLAPEKAAERAAAAKERAELKALQQEQVLLVSQKAEKTTNKRSFKYPSWAMDPASSLVVLTWQEPLAGGRAPLEWRCFSPPRWQEEKWDGPATERLDRLHFSTGGSWLAVPLQFHSQIDIWDRRANRIAAQKKFLGNVSTMMFSADENWLFIVVHNQDASTHLHRVALRPGLKDAVLVEKTLHFKAIAPHPNGSFLAIVDNFGLLLVVDIQTMRIRNQVWIKETNSLLPEGLREKIVGDAKQKIPEMMKGHLSAEKLEHYRQQCDRHFLPKDSIHTCAFSPEGDWLFCGTYFGLRGLDWKTVLECPEMCPVPVDLSVEAESVTLDIGGRSTTAQKMVYGIVFDATRRRVLFCGLEGKITFVELDGGRTGTLLENPGKFSLVQLALTPDRSALVSTACRPRVSPNKQEAPLFQIWSYPALCRKAGLNY